jgi:hypothetical protein
VILKSQTLIKGGLKAEVLIEFTKLCNGNKVDLGVLTEKLLCFHLKFLFLTTTLKGIRVQNRLYNRVLAMDNYLSASKIELTEPVPGELNLGTTFVLYIRKYRCVEFTIQLAV